MKPLVFLCFLVFAAVAVTDGRRKKVTVLNLKKYTVENTAVRPYFTNVFIGRVRVRHDRDTTPDLVNFMAAIADEIDPAFSFFTYNDVNIGAFFLNFNRQKQVPADNLYWLLLVEFKKDGETKECYLSRCDLSRSLENERCYLPVGVFSYEPSNKETLIWRLSEYNINVPTCDGGDDSK